MSDAVRTVLVLGGTGEARALAGALHDGAGGDGVRVISTLAGRVADPRLPRGEVRVGGFGGPEGLAAYLREEGVQAVVDATHPFAERMSWSACAACATAGTRLLRLERPPFARDPAIDWREVRTLDEAAALLPAAGRRVFLTTGRQGLAAFRPVSDAFFLVRCVDPPDPAALPRDHEVLLDRGPYDVAGELALIDRHALDVLVTKDSGGALTEAKLAAARERGLPVIVVARPPRPDAETVGSVEQALAWLRHAG
ncbi:MAG: precorrin-6A/cobalt-precorrin-6A reductase [Solirubrobacteraceae bacterium]|nr:precorrin-6A/cobalt-precorrin-6A reductase [Solirubrobacteraceae bacterium]